MTTLIASFLILLGAAFALIAGIGIVRMPGVFCRMHAATKAGAFASALILLGLVVVAPSLRTILESILIISFFFLTAPIGAQMIGRVALQRNVEVWDRERPDESGGK